MGIFNNKRERRNDAEVSLGRIGREQNLGYSNDRGDQNYMSERRMGRISSAYTAPVQTTQDYVAPIDKGRIMPSGRGASVQQKILNTVGDISGQRAIGEIIGGAIAKPYVREQLSEAETGARQTAARAYQAIQRAKQSGNQADMQRALKAYQYAGESIAGVPSVDRIIPRKTPLQVIGAIGESALGFLGAGIEGKLAKTGLSIPKAISSVSKLSKLDQPLQALGRISKTSVPMGILGGATVGMQEKDATVGSIARNSLIGGGAGLALGAAGVGLGRISSRLGNKTQNISEHVDSLVDEVSKEQPKGISKGKKLRKGRISKEELDSLDEAYQKSETDYGVPDEIKKARLNELEQEVFEKEMLYEAMNDTLKKSPYKELSKFTYKRTGELPEIAGTGSKFGREGDEITANLGFKDSEEARSGYQGYVKQKESLKEIKRSLSEAKAELLREKRSTNTRIKPVISKNIKPIEQETMQILRGTKGLTEENIDNPMANIRADKNIPAKDIYGNKVQIPEGEVLTPYPVKGKNQVLLQDGEAYLVDKNQFQNIKGQSVGGEARPFAPELEGLEETVRGYDAKYTITRKVDRGEISWEEAKDLISKTTKPETKYSQYQLPDGENYKEILIKAPQKYKGTGSGLPDGYSYSTGIDGYRVINDKTKAVVGESQISQEKALQNALKNIDEEPIFKSSHWDEPNVISHLRMNERTYNGKKVAFMEELQSDWAREARKASDEVTKELDMYKRDLRLLEESDNVVNKEAKIEALKEKIADMASDEPQIPSNPNLKNWQELTTKRALKEAVDSGADYFAWINGEQTSARYNLATQVDPVEWAIGKNTTKNVDFKKVTIKPKGGESFVIAVDKDGKILSSLKNFNWEGKKLDEVLGKGLADKIMERESGTLSGEGLKFGGEWASNLYDKQVGNIVKDLTGAKIEVLDLGLPTGEHKPSFWVENATGRTTHQKMVVGDEKIGKQIQLSGNGNPQDYIITDILGDGKFKAIPKDSFIYSSEAKTKYGDNWTNKYKRFGEMSSTVGVDGRLSEKVYPISREETFDISQKTTTQQGIKLTPEIKARIRGESIELKNSGKKFEAVKKTEYVGSSGSQTKTEVFSPLKSIGDGEKRTRGLSISTEALAIEKELTDGFSELPTYGTVNMKDQAEKALNLIKTDYDRAVRVAMGQERHKDILPESVYVALSNKAAKTNDVELLRKLATQSDLAEEGTAMGQRLRALGEMDSESPLSVMRKVVHDRETQIMKKYNNKSIANVKKEIVGDIKKHISKNDPTANDWNAFVRSIQC